MPCFVSCRYPVGAGGEYQSGAKCRELPREFVCCFALSAKIIADWRSVVAAGGAQAQSGSKRGMNSCDALLCILSGRAEGIKVARSGANCRVNSCAALLFLQKFLRIGAACRAGCGAMVLQPSMFCKKNICLLRYRDGPLWPWAFSNGYSLYDCSGSCKGSGHTHLIGKEFLGDSQFSIRPVWVWQQCQLRLFSDHAGGRGPSGARLPCCAAHGLGECGCRARARRHPGPSGPSFRYASGRAWQPEAVWHWEASWR